jgi:hypothetical protein
MAGINRAKQQPIYSNYSSPSNTPKPCVFISYTKKDKAAAETVEEEFRKYGIDTYFDENDSILIDAVNKEDAEKITAQIQKGIEKSTHILCILSDKTKDSWWVPFEIGYGKKSSVSLSTLSLKDVQRLPAYLQIIENIGGIGHLQMFINRLSGVSLFTETLGMFSKSRLSAHLNP